MQIKKTLDPIYELVFDLSKGSCGQADHRYLKRIQSVIMLKPIVKKGYG